ncbi:FecR family protein [Olivibacter ginsenosidimutans]|uniref:FecR family protein n=1 Tax=Olivibacter ginsenosidimutans TaxID=1176537 RepID=A0ABP9CCE7_9SPHI
MEINQELLDKYYLNQCIAEEQAAVEKWLEEEPIGYSLPKDVDIQSLENRQWERFQQKMQDKEMPRRQAVVYLKRYVWPIAASFLLLTSILLFFRINHSQQRGAIVYRTYTTKAGQRAQITLQDGTKVLLNASSHLRYPENFGNRSREVFLSGEAFFEIASDAKRPFSVRTLRTITHVLGTTFNLKAYPDENQTSIVVATGLVRFSASEGKSSLLLGAGKRGILTNGKVFQQASVALANYMGWKDDKLIIDDQPLAEVFPLLERWYNVRIEVTDTQLLKERYKGQFDHPRLAHVLKSIGFATHFHYRIEKNQLIIYRKP